AVPIDVRSQVPGRPVDDLCTGQQSENAGPHRTRNRAPEERSVQLAGEIGQDDLVAQADRADAGDFLDFQGHVAAEAFQRLAVDDVAVDGGCAAPGNGAVVCH